MLPMILIDIIILLAVGIPIAILHRKWSAWIDRQSRNVWPFRGRKRFGLRSWAARSFVLDTPVERVKELIDGLPEMPYAEAAAMIEARGRTGSFMALAPLAGRQVFTTGIETEWIAPDTVGLHAHSYADWPLSSLDKADLPAKQYQMVFEHAVLCVEPNGERQARVSYELQTPSWIYLLWAAITLLVGWATWMIWRTLDPAGQTARANLTLMALLTEGTLLSATELLRLQSIALMDSVISTFGPPVPRQGSDG